MAVYGHAILKESTPAANSTVAGPDINVRLKFNSRVDAAHSRLYLNGKSGAEELKIEKQSEPDTLRTHVAEVTAGAYRIQWQVLAVDGHITRGEIPFTVR
jgi:hypothetical protein